MTKPYLYALTALLLFLALLSVIGALVDPTPGVQLGHAPPTHPVGMEAVDHVATMAPGIQTTTTAKSRQVTTVRAGGADVWDALCECECGGNWLCNTGNGYSGGLQMDAEFWEAYGGLEFASEPWMATREQQIVVAERGRAERGFHPWPKCARRLGLIT